MLSLQQEVERLTLLVTLLHDAGLIPTDLYLLSDLRAQRAVIEREIRVWVDTHETTCPPKRLMDDLARLDTQIRHLEAHL